MLQAPLASPRKASAAALLLLIAAGAGADDCNLNGIPDAVDVRPSFHFGAVEFDTAFSPEDAVASAVVGVNDRVPLDANGDGNADAIVIGGDVHRSAVIYLGDGQGGFSPQPLSVDLLPDASYTCIAAGQFAGDSAHDLALGYWDTKTNKYYAVILTNNAGAFAPGISEPLSGYPLGMAAADFSGDGRPDLVVTLAATFRVATLKNMGDGNLGSEQHAVYPGAAGGVPSVADIDGDDDLDVAVATESTSKAVILYNNGAGALTDYDEYETDGLGVYAVALSDFSGDGIPDLSTANRGSNSVSILLNKGDGSLNTAKAYKACFCAGLEPYRIEAGDFDGDGDADVAVGCLSFPDGKVSLLAGNGDGTLVDPVVFAAPNHTYGMDSGDLNSDGLPDLVLACLDVEGGDDSNAVILLNAAAPFSEDCNHNGVPDECDLRPRFTFSPPQNFDVTDQPVNLIARKMLNNNTEAPLDFNADGYPDIVTAEEGGFVSVLINKGKVQGQWGGFNPSVPYQGGDGPIAVAAGRLDADADADLVASDVQGGKLAVLFNEGGGVFGDPDLYENLSNGGNIAGVALADFDGDGDLDIAATFGADAMVAILFNDGTGKFTLDDTYAVQIGPRSVTIADLDKKSGIDLVVSCEGGEDPAVCILLNKGDGTFNPAKEFDAGDEPYHTVVADLNGDGRLDLGVANNGVQMDREYSLGVLFGDGDGAFGPVALYPVLAKRIDAADFNKDGLPDLATSAGFGVTIFHNLGGPLAEAGYSETGTNTSGTVAADFDQDGDPDLAITNQADDSISVLLYAGMAPPHSPDADDDGIPDECVCYADFDQSGALDFFDFLAFVNAYNNQEPRADCVGDGAFDFFDFLCFVNAFNAGC